MSLKVPASHAIAKISENEWKTFLAIADTFAPPVNVEYLQQYASKNEYSASFEELSEFAKSSPSTLTSFIDHLKETLALAPINVREKFAFILKLLSHRSTAILFTGSTTLLVEMSIPQREKVLISWFDSRITPLRELFRSFDILSHTTFIRINPLGYKAMGHPQFDPHRFDSDRSKDFYTFDILDIGRYSTSAEINVDVVVIGSGSGGGVVAHNLSKITGLTVLVIEKGKYYHQNELNFNEDLGHKNLYDHGLTIISEDGSITVASGSTLGGGSTINWSASLRTPDIVRKEWSSMGVPWYNEKIYDDALDHVMNQMGCSTDNITHSFTNNLILEGSKSLGYESESIPQNSGNYEHKCGFCCYGCKHGEKQGGVVNWLREAVERGNTNILTETDVVRIIKQGRRASGIEAVVHQHGRDIPLKVNARKVVVAGGALQSPGLLQRSGFQNKNIGQHLKMHPMATTFGYFPDKELNAFENSILTAVCTEVADIDGHGHGSRIEAMLHQPLHTMGFYPWRNGKEWRKLQVEYNHLSSLMVVQREVASGRVFYSPDMPFRPRIDYTVGESDFVHIAQGLATASDLLYIQGAKELIAPVPSVPIFTAKVPVGNRSLSDPDYEEWVRNLRNTKLRPLKINFVAGHQMSSCRLGDDPRSSVANQRGQLWECDNVYIVDAGAFPTGSGVNPMISVMATAHVISGFIREDLNIKDIF